MAAYDTYLIRNLDFSLFLYLNHQVFCTRHQHECIPFARYATIILLRPSMRTQNEPSLLSAAGAAIHSNPPTA